jgi:signal transduction histidine kinase
MIRNRPIVLFILAFAGATSIFWLVIHQISGLWLDVAVRPEVTSALRESLDDQKKLRALDAAHRDDYRRRFETNAKLLHRLEVIRMSREEMLQRFELVFVALFAIVAAGAALALWSRMHHAQAAERRRYLDLVSTLQETARRHAHEFKGPLTAARLDLDHLADALRGGADESEIATAMESVNNELEALARFTRQYMTFAAIGTPLVQRLSLRGVVDEFCATFGGAWPGLTLHRDAGDAFVCADRDMLRQVLVNLCTNSARAIAANGMGSGSVTFSIQRHGRVHALDVIDDGRGIADSLRDRVFDPYVTTQNSGEGMGLGLAISRKIMLDHGGDLQLLSTSANGTTFRILFGDQTCN